MGIFTRLLGLSEGDSEARRRGEQSAPRLTSSLARDAGGRDYRPGEGGTPEDDPLTIANVEAAMAARETPLGRAARRKIMEALDDDKQCEQLVGAMRRIMREGGDA